MGPLLVILSSSVRTRGHWHLRPCKKTTIGAVHGLTDGVGGGLQGFGAVLFCNGFGSGNFFSWSRLQLQLRLLLRLLLQLLLQLLLRLLLLLL